MDGLVAKGLQPSEALSVYQPKNHLNMELFGDPMRIPPLKKKAESESNKRK